MNIEVELKTAICDVPVRAMGKETKQFNSYYGCDQCTQRGEYLNRRMTFPEYDNLTLRIDASVFISACGTVGDVEK